MGGSSKKQTVGYKYYLGMHMILCHGPVDKLVRISVDGRTAWLGRSTGGRINIDADDLFGGEKREGGISGAVDFETGHATQARNGYLQDRLGSAIPAFRGVVGLVLRQCYLGINPYLKRWSARPQRIHVRQSGVDQWYDTKAEINSYSDQVNFLHLKSVDGVFYDEAGGVINYFGGLSGISFDGLNDYIQITHDVSRSLRYDYSFKVKASFASIPDDGVTMMFASQNYGSTSERSFIFGLTGAGGGASYLQFRTTPDGTLASAVVNTVAWTPVVGDIYDVEVIRRAGILRFFVNGSQLGPSQANVVEPFPVALPVSIGATADILDFFHGTIYSLQIISDTTYADLNPAHIIRECLTDPDWGMGYLDSDIDDAAFIVAANQLHAESMGISILWDRQIPIEDFVTEIVRHINAALYVDRVSGKFVLKLIRADFEDDDLLILGEDEIDRVDGYSRPAFGEMVNSVTVNFWDSATGKTSSVTAQDTALIQLQGSVIGTTLQYPGFTNHRIATLVAMRNLQAMSFPLLSCTIYANRVAASLNIGDAFRFEWPDYHDGYIVMRVTSMALGDGRKNAVRITCLQDVFSLPETAAVSEPDDTWDDPSVVPVPAVYRLVTEAPYYELVQRLGQTQADTQLVANPDAGLILASAGRPAGAINATLMVDSGAGYQNSGVVDFCPFAILSVDISPDDTVIAITGGDGLDEIPIGSHAQIDGELVRIDAVTDTEMTIGRGVIDTVPAAHVSGTVVLAWDYFAEGDSVEYAAGETINIRLLPVSGAGVVDLESAPIDAVTLASRAARPYPPGRLLLNTEAYPVAIGGLSGLSIGWAHRDRLSQTAGDLQDTTVGNIGPEAGTTYNLSIYGEASTLLRTISGITGTSHTYTTENELSDTGIATEDSMWATVSLLLNFNGPNGSKTITDSSPSPKTITAIGNAKISTEWFRYGGSSGYLGGAGDYFRIPNSSAFQLSADFTIETVIRFVALPASGSQAAIITNWDGGSGNRSFYLILLNNAGTMQIGLGISADGGTTNSTQTFINWTPSINTDYHIAVCRSGSSCRIFIDGVQIGATFTNSRSAYLSANPVCIGVFEGAVYPVSGYYEDLRLTLSARYVTDFTPPNQALGRYTYDSRLNGKLRIVLESKRDGLASLQAHDYTVIREGYGFNYGKLYGGDA